MTNPPRPTLARQLLRRKPVTQMEAESGSETGQSELTRSIGLFQLSAFGIGATIGTGIFFVLSEAVPIAGPAVIWSFVIAGVVAGLTAVCYAELAGAVPVSGSSYSYAYATMGELVAMVVAACLLLEYGLSEQLLPSAGRNTSTNCSTTYSVGASRKRCPTRPKKVAWSTCPRSS